MKPEEFFNIAGGELVECKVIKPWRKYIRKRIIIRDEEDKITIRLQIDINIMKRKSPNKEWLINTAPFLSFRCWIDNLKKFITQHTHTE